jgi:hypothetical protein
MAHAPSSTCVIADPDQLMANPSQLDVEYSHFACLDNSTFRRIHNHQDRMLSMVMHISSRNSHFSLHRPGRLLRHPLWPKSFDPLVAMALPRRGCSGVNAFAERGALATTGPGLVLQRRSGGSEVRRLGGSEVRRSEGVTSLDLEGRQAGPKGPKEPEGRPARRVSSEGPAYQPDLRSYR